MWTCGFMPLCHSINYFKSSSILVVDICCYFGLNSTNYIFQWLHFRLILYLGKWMGGCFKNNLNFIRKKNIIKWLYQTILITLWLNKGEHVFHLQSRTKSVYELYISAKWSWKEEYIFMKYSRNLNISWIIFQVCHIKQYF